MTKQFKIYDWAGNRIGNQTFTSYLDAWDYILGDLTDSLGLTDDDYQEYYAYEDIDRESRYLDPNDPRANRKKRA
jgi:hypothetical protein